MLSKQLVYTLGSVLVFKLVIATSEDSSFTDVTLLNDGTEFDILDYRFAELLAKELEEAVPNNQGSIEENQPQSSNQVSLISNYAKQMLDLQSICANHGKILEELDRLKPDHTDPLGIRASDSSNSTESSTLTPIRSCNETNTTTSGVFQLLLPDDKISAMVYCDMELFGGGWLVFQRRNNGSVEFFRNWSEYRNGFGDVEEEFWAGLNLLHVLTRYAFYELLVELEDSSGIKTYAHYSDFEIGSEEEKYSLKTLGSYSGTMPDRLDYHLGMKFSTFDRDNDNSKDNCAKLQGGAWWFNDCSRSSLNRKYKYGLYWMGMSDLKRSRMMLRLKYYV